jgi:hypothetical protein
MQLAADSVALLLSAQRALLGAIGPHLLALGVELEPAPAGRRTLKVRVYANEELTTEELDDLQAAATEMIDDFPSASVLDVAVHRLSRPLLPKGATGHWAFIRRDVRLANEQS